jgi:hypothetical protein
LSRGLSAPQPWEGPAAPHQENFLDIFLNTVKMHRFSRYYPELKLPWQK